MIKGYLNSKRDSHHPRFHSGSDTKPLHRLDFGRNNDGCAPEVASELRALLSGFGDLSILHAYPPFGECALHDRIAERHRVSPSRVCLTAGIEQAIGMTASGFLEKGDRVLAAAPSFFLFGVASARVGAEPVGVPLDEASGFAFDENAADRFVSEINRVAPKIVWAASPNNPTGRSIPPGYLRLLATETAKRGCLLAVDEAYGEYTDPDGGVSSATSLLSEFPNVMVFRTFSKAFGLAGLRIGYAIARDEATRDRLWGFGFNFPVSGLAIAAATAALQYDDHLERTRAAVRTRRAALFDRLKGISRVEALDSETCIFLLRCQGLSADALFSALTARGVVTARIPGQCPAGTRYVRVTLGRESQNEALIAALADISQNEGSDSRG